MHKHQLKILNKLLYRDEGRFSDLKDTALSSEHFTYHLSQLVDKGFVVKVGNLYQLTDKGKDFVGKLDEITLEEEKGPKVSVLIFVRKRTNGGSYEYLMSKRMKRPYLGKIGGITGKVRFGETFYEAAARELLEETGLKAGLKLCHVYHKVRKNRKGTPLQDSIFLIFLGESPEGELCLSKEAELLWIEKKDLFTRDDLFDDLKGKWKLTGNEKTMKIVEDVGSAEGF
ncbi:MAG: NUDIX domain-containing protein [Patescibacteria group bacterium]|nr:NUDIX domain-containing protein [Patescibacteria group bacterium]